MEEGKEVKKNNTPMLVIAFAVVLILAGVVLIATGNNKSFIAKEKNPVPQDEPKDNTEI